MTPWRLRERVSLIPPQDVCARLRDLEATKTRRLSFGGALASRLRSPAATGDMFLHPHSATFRLARYCSALIVVAVVVVPFRVH